MAQLKVYRDRQWVVVPLEATFVPAATDTKIGGVRVTNGTMLRVNSTGLLYVDEDELKTFIETNYNVTKK